MSSSGTGSNLDAEEARQMDPKTTKEAIQLVKMKMRMTDKRKDKNKENRSSDSFEKEDDSDG
jgi:hypothetical protein